MVKFFKKLLKFLQLTDKAGDLSISNIAVIVVITKIAITSTFDWATSATLLMALLNYSHKRHATNKAVRDEQLDQKEAEVVKQVSELVSRVSSLEGTQEQVAKQAEQVQKIISTSNLASAFFKPKQ